MVNEIRIRKITPQQQHWLDGLQRAIAASEITKQILDPKDPTKICDLKVTLDGRQLGVDSVSVRIFDGAAKGLFNELAHPVIEKEGEGGNIVFIAGVDKKMRATAKKAIISTISDVADSLRDGVEE